MNLLSALKQIAGVDFKSMEEAVEFYINEDFLTNFFSSDVNFAIAYESITGSEPRYNAAPKAFDLLKGIPNTFNKSKMGIGSRLKKFKSAFEPKSLKYNPKQTLTSQYLEKAFYKILNRSQDTFNLIRSYADNVIISEQGLDSILKYFRGKNKIEIQVKTETVDVEVESLININEGQFKVLLFNTVTTLDERLYQAPLSETQLNLFKNYITRYLHVKDPELETNLGVSGMEINYLQAMYTEYGLKHKAVVDPKMSKRILIQLYREVEKNDLYGIMSMCQLLSAYKRFALDDILYCKTKEQQEVEDTESIQSLVSITKSLSDKDIK